MANENIELIAISVDEAARKLSISRSLAWEMVWAGRLKTVSLGRRRLVPIQALRDLMEEADAQQCDNDES